MNNTQVSQNVVTFADFLCLAYNADFLQPFPILR